MMINKNTQENHEFFTALTNAGVPLTEGWGPLECSRAVNAWLHDNSARDMKLVFTALNQFVESHSSLTDEVQEAIAQIKGQHSTH
jgi:hypothetical protein